MNDEIVYYYHFENFLGTVSIHDFKDDVIILLASSNINMFLFLFLLTLTCSCNLSDLWYRKRIYEA